MLLLIILSAFFAPTDPDYWWHVRTGQYIYETGTLPRVDIFSYTASGQHWVTHEWLTEVLLYLVARQFGYVGSVVLFGLISALAAVLVYATCRRRAIAGPAAALLALWSFAIALPLTNVRPQMLTLLLLALCALLLTRYKQGRVRALWALPPLLALWVNLHGGYVIGLVLLGLTLVGEILSRVFRREAAPLRPLLIVVALSIAGTLLNPHGVEALRYPFTYAGTGNASMRYIAEWQSPSFHQPAYLAFAASLLLALALGIGRRPLGPTELLWSLLLALMGLQAIRHLPLYAVVVTPLVGARLGAELQRYRGGLLVWARRARIACLALAWLLPLATALVVLAQVRAGQIGGLQLGREPSAAGYPAGAVQYIRTHELRGNLYNQYGWGGYLIYELYPRHRVFVDGRADVYGDAFVAAAREVEKLGPDWARVLNQNDVQLVLVGKESPLAVALRDNPRWEEVYTGPVEGLFARRVISAPARGAN